MPRADRQDAAARRVHRNVIAFLAKPDSYPHRPRVVEVVQTHASVVFLAGRYVYKVKKPVDFGFLDFSTLARRRHFCEREVELNRRLAPDVYLDVVAVRRAGRTLSLAGTGSPVEYAVRMRRLSAAGFASHRLKRGLFGPRDVDRIAKRLARFYAEQSAGSHGRLPDRQRRSIEDNLTLIRRHARDATARRRVAVLAAFTRTFYEAQAPLLARRRREKRILDCHGDLRLEHVHLDGTRVRIYDCIEFNERLRTIDVANDIAFLAMDLDYEGRSDLARRLVDAIVRDTHDRGLQRVLDFYKCYRAAVRHKVECLRAAEREVGAAEQRASSGRAERFLRLALRYATLGSRPTIVAVMGEVACGKSTMATGLADALGIELFSSDVTRKRLAGLPLRRRPSDAVRTRLYAPAMSHRVYGLLLKAASSAVHEERSVALDATFARKQDRDELRDFAARINANLLFIEIVTPAAVRRRRLTERAHAASVSDARLSDFTVLAARYEPPAELPAASFLQVRSRTTPDATLAAALLSLAKKRGQTPLFSIPTSSR
jgi:aminoglycoside phosphotransferase family enzyme/predicted kinase